MIRTPGENHRLLVAAGPHNTRIHLTQGSHESAEVAPMFLMLLRKHLGGGRILSIRQLQGDRLLDITVSALDEMGERREKHLYFEAMGRHTNFTLVDDGMIIDCARRITDDMSRVRRVMPGLPYEMPPRQDKADPTTATAAELALRLRAMGGRADKALAETVSGLSLTTKNCACWAMSARCCKGRMWTPLRATWLPFLQSCPGWRPPRCCWGRTTCPRMCCRLPIAACRRSCSAPLPPCPRPWTPCMTRKIATTA